MQSLNVAPEGQNHIQSSNPNAPRHVSCDTMDHVHEPRNKPQITSLEVARMLNAISQCGN
jgi:hypothetical protein